MLKIFAGHNTVRKIKTCKTFSATSKHKNIFVSCVALDENFKVNFFVQKFLKLQYVLSWEGVNMTSVNTQLERILEFVGFHG